MATWYKRMMLLGGGMLTAGTLWYQGRAYLAPMGIDYAEVDGAAIERAWLGLPDVTAGGNVSEAGLRAAMTNDFASAFRPSWAFVAGTLANRVIDTFNLSRSYNNENLLWWIHGGNIVGGPLYTRTATGVTLNGWSPLMDYAETITALDYSSDITHVTYGMGAVSPIDANTLGNADANGFLTNFTWQTRNWHMPSTNDLNVMRAVLTNMTRIACFSARVATGLRIDYSELYTGEVRNVSGGLNVLGAGAWNALALQSRSVTTTVLSTVSGGVGVKMCGWVDAYAGGSLTNATATFNVNWSEYRGLTSSWPNAFCMQTGLVTAATVYTCPRYAFMDDIETWTGGSDDPAAFFWHTGNTGLIATPTLFTESVTTSGDTDHHDLAIASPSLESVGTVGTPFDMVFTWTKPDFSELTIRYEDEFEGEVEGRSWILQRGSGFYFVIVPELDLQYLVD